MKHMATRLIGHEETYYKLVRHGEAIGNMGDRVQVSST
jgi:hypothetical protein